MLRDYNVQANVGKPQVAYKETVTRSAEADYRLVKQIGARHHYAYVVLKVEPHKDPHKPVVFENHVSKEKIPLEFIPFIRDGALGSAQAGVVVGYPMINLKITLIGGDFDPAASSEVAFSEAASVAFHKAAEKGAPALLEPVMRLEIMVPDEYLGEIVTDLGTRRGEIIAMDVVGDKTRLVRASVPLATMFGYATTIRSLSQGRASFTMEPHKYVQAPEEMLKKFIS
jgi:elongation factor G